MRSIFLGALMGAAAAVIYYVGERDGYQKAEAKMLKTNPPSEALELACLGLWVGEQNKKYWEKENANKSK